MEFSNRQREVPISVEHEVVAKLVQAVLDHEEEQAEYVSLFFVGDRAMRRYHRLFFDDPSSTDCISFPMDTKPQEGLPRHLGDVFVCPKVALIASSARNGCFWKELSLYIVHGLLHLLGYDDVRPTDRTVMRRREQSAMRLLQRKNLILHGSVEKIPKT